MTHTKTKRVLSAFLAVTLFISCFIFNLNISLPVSAAEDSTRYTVLVLDTSSDVPWHYGGFFGFGEYTHIVGSPIEYTKAAAKRFCEQIGNKSEIAIISYDGEARVNHDYSTDTASLLSAIDRLQKPAEGYSDGDDDTWLPEEGNSNGNLVDALTLAKGKILEAPENSVKNIVVFNTGYCTPYIRPDGSFIHYKVNGHYPDSSDSNWEFEGTSIQLCEAANAVYDTAQELHDNRWVVHSIGLFQNYEDAPSTMQTPITLLRTVAKDIASTPTNYYEVKDIDKLIATFEDVADDILNPVNITLSYELINSSSSGTTRHDNFKIEAKVSNPNKYWDMTNVSLTLKIPENLKPLTSVELADGEEAVKSIDSLSEANEDGSITQEETVTWNISYEAIQSSEDQNLVFEVSVVADNAPVPVSNFISVFAEGNNAENNTFEFGKDTWSFQNYDVETIPLSDELKPTLFYGMTNSVKQKILSTIKEGSNGQCYGMAITSVLAKVNRLDLHGFDSLYSFPQNPDSESIIAFYFLLQYTPQHLNVIHEFQGLPTETKLNKLYELGSNVKQGGSTFLILFSWNKGGHAVTGYGIESGTWEFGGEILGIGKRNYDTRVLIYDNNSIVNDTNYYLYFNKGTNQWFIPEYNCGNDKNNGIIDWATDNITLLDFQNPDTTEKNMQAVIKANSDAKLFIRIADKLVIYNGYETDSTDGFYVRSDYATASDTLNIIFDDANTPFEISPQTTGEALDLSIKYADTYSEVETTNAASAKFNPAGIVGVDGNSGAFRLSLAADNSPLSLFNINVSGKSIDSATLTLAANGFILEGESLTDVTVSGNNADTTKTFTIASNGSDSVLISEEKGALTAKADKDGDGTYESLIGSSAGITPEPEPEPEPDKPTPTPGGNSGNGSSSNSNRPAVPTVSVNPYVRLNKSNLTLSVGGTQKLTATSYPASSALTWSTDNEKVATVSEDGTVKAIAVGKANIKVTNADGKTATCVVTVKDNVSYSLKDEKGKTYKANGTLTVGAIKTAYSRGIKFLYADTKIGGKIVSRVKLDITALYAKVMSGNTDAINYGSTVYNIGVGSSVQKLIDKNFGQIPVVVHMNQQDILAAPVEIAVKVDLSKLDKDNLLFYAYDKENKKVIKLNTSYRIDKNGFLHFRTDKAYDILIVDEKLTKK